MVRDIKFIFYGMSHSQLKAVLKENKQLKTFPLVDKPESMVLLGSIQRVPLIQLIERHIGKERRLQVNYDYIRKIVCKINLSLLITINPVNYLIFRLSAF